MPVHRFVRKRLLALLLAATVVSSGCVNEEATPIDPANPPSTDPAELTDVTHLFEPNDQMREAAAKQCLDDPSLEEGYIRAVDPANPDNVVSELTVDCAEIREE